MTTAKQTGPDPSGVDTADLHAEITDRDVEHWKALTRVDWVVSTSWNRLHHVDGLTGQQWRDFEFDATLSGPIRLACGRTAAGISIPGVFTRMGAPRCAGCCRATGLPQGVGSPKNDNECRKILGLEPALSVAELASRARQAL